MNKVETNLLASDDDKSGEDTTKVDVHNMSNLLKKGFTLILVLILILAVLNILQLQKTKNNLNNLVSTNIKKMAHGSIMRDSIRLRTISIYKMLNTDDIFDREEELTKFYAHANRYRQARMSTIALGVTEIEKTLNDKIIEQISISQPIIRDVAADMISTISELELQKRVNIAVENQRKLFGLLNQLNELQRNQTANALEAVNKNFNFTIILTLIVTAIVIFLCLQIAKKLYLHVINTSQILTDKNTDLEKAYIKAEESTKIKSEFLAKMSHEIRTPMNGVMGMLQLLLIEDLNAQQKNYAKTALNSSKSLLTIINDILDFSKMEAGKLEIENIKFNFTSTINNIISTVANSAQQKQLELNCLIAPDVEEYYIGDANRISQILINLIGNAVKFTKQGKIKINISINESNATSSIVYIEICDTGIGISDEDKQKLFTSFNQADNSISRSYGGTGLGLAISKQLCILMGGEIGVSDGKKGGSTFWFTLNLQRTKEQQNEEKTIEHTSISTAENEKAEIKNILIVEDNIVNQMVVTKMLENLGYLSDVAENGKVAIEKIQLKKYDLILMDCEMPVMNGFEATQKIRELQKEKIVSPNPIIALTGNAMKGDKEKCVAAGMDDFIAKPFEINTVSTMLETWLK